MSKRRTWVLFLLIALLATAPESARRAQARDAPHEPVDIVLVIDNSGSMALEQYGGNDIEGLRFAAARLLVDLAAEGDRVAVVQFASSASVIGGSNECRVESMADVAGVDVGPCPLIEITDAGRDSFMDVIQLPPAPTGFTCMQFGLGLAHRLLDAERTPGRAQAILFLTDGNFVIDDAVQCDANEPDMRGDLDDVIARLGRSDIVTYPIILGDQVSDDVPEQLVRATGGRVYRAADAGGLLPAFAEFYAALQPSRYAVPLEPPASGPRELTLITTPEQKVTEINFVVPYGTAIGTQRGEEAFGPGTMSDGTERADRADRNAAGEPQYEIITLRGNPLVGRWRVSLASGAEHGLAVVEAGVAPTLRFPVARQIFAARHVSQREDGYLLVPVAVSDGQIADIDIHAPGQELDNSPADLNFRRMPHADGPFDFTVRVGESVDPLVLQRTFEIRPGDFPRLEVVEIVSGAAGIPARFVVGWAADTGFILDDTQVDLFVVDSTGALVYNPPPEAFSCADNVCIHEGFEQPPGRTYTAWLLASATLPDGTLFSDYIVDDLVSDPQLQVRNLPDSIDLTENAGPFPIEVVVQSEADPGQLLVELVDATGSPAAARPRLTLESDLTPGATVSGQLIFDDLAALPATGFSGEMRFSSDTVRVVPEKRAVTYRPRVVLTLDQTIDLAQSIGPYDISARLTGGKPTELIATIVDPASGEASRIKAQLSLPELQPGVETAGSLTFVVPADLPAAPYAGRVIFETLDSTPVDPGSIAVELLLDPVVVELITDDSQLNFGYWLDPAQPITVPLQIEFSNRPVPLAAELVGLSADVPLVASLRPIGEKTGPGPQPAELSLALDESSSRLPVSELVGSVRLSVNHAVGGDVRPAEIPFRLERPTYWSVFLWCDPAHRVWTLSSAQSIFCFFWPRETLIDQKPVETKWDLWALFRSVGTLVFGMFMFLFIRARVGDPPLKDKDDGGRPPPPPPLPPPPPPIQPTGLTRPPGSATRQPPQPPGGAMRQPPPRPIGGVTRQSSPGSAGSQGRRPPPPPRR